MLPAASIPTPREAPARAASRSHNQAGGPGPGGWPRVGVDSDRVEDLGPGEVLTLGSAPRGTTRGRAPWKAVEALGPGEVLTLGSAPRHDKGTRSSESIVPNHDDDREKLFPARPALAIERQQWLASARRTRHTSDRSARDFSLPGRRDDAREKFLPARVPTPLNGICGRPLLGEHLRPAGALVLSPGLTTLNALIMC